ncbi:hypothetical protein LCGC14_2489850 [marine sediment metagenome]|uniref:Uncharacterized protein n=1 Tax=marine sediment metagenome TaxID=412755 RepID=A0A0F9B544_9ZZZZ
MDIIQEVLEILDNNRLIPPNEVSIEVDEAWDLAYDQSNTLSERAVKACYLIGLSQWIRAVSEIDEVDYDFLVANVPIVSSMRTSPADRPWGKSPLKSIKEDAVDMHQKHVKGFEKCSISFGFSGVGKTEVPPVNWKVLHKYSIGSDTERSSKMLTRVAIVENMLSEDGKKMTPVTLVGPEDIHPPKGVTLREHMLMTYAARLKGKDMSRIEVVHSYFQRV